MKRSLLLLVLLTQAALHGQEHFTGLITSQRAGIITAGMNPAELTNISSKFEVNIIGAGINTANNKIGFSDLMSDRDIGEMIFVGDEPVNMRFDAEVYGPSVAIQFKSWAFGLTTKANGKLNIIDVDTSLGDAVSNGGLNLLFATSLINNDTNQRIIGTSWGEVNLTAAKTLVETDMHKFNAGISLKLLFPGSYANLGAESFTGTIVQSAGQAFLTDTYANVNFAYSGTLAGSFDNFGDYAKSVYGGLNGVATDIGFNYQWRGEKSDSNRYRLNAGVALRNMGSMTFKDDNNNSTNYVLEIQGTESLNLNQFENVDSLQEVETILLNSGYLTRTSGTRDFKVKLPTTLSLYADVKLLPILYVSAFLQQKLNDENENDQITASNVFTFTPRVNLGLFEAWLPLSSHEVSGFATGLGLQFKGFYIGSGSVITALLSDSKQADLYMGFRWGFL